jgi:hypothetical protein
MLNNWQKSRTEYYTAKVREAGTLLQGLFAKSGAIWGENREFGENGTKLSRLLALEFGSLAQFGALHFLWVIYEYI